MVKLSIVYQSCMMLPWTGQVSEREDDNHILHGILNASPFRNSYTSSGIISSLYHSIIFKNVMWKLPKEPIPYIPTHEWLYSWWNCKCTRCSIIPNNWLCPSIASRLRLLCSYSRWLSAILAWEISLMWWLSVQGGWHCRRTKSDLATTTFQWKVDTQHDNKSTKKAIILWVYFKGITVDIASFSFPFPLCSW